MPEPVKNPCHCLSYPAKFSGLFKSRFFLRAVEQRRNRQFASFLYVVALFVKLLVLSAKLVDFLYGLVVFGFVRRVGRVSLRQSVFAFLFLHLGVVVLVEEFFTGAATQREEAEKESSKDAKRDNLFHPGGSPPFKSLREKHHDLLLICAKASATCGLLLARHYNRKGFSLSSKKNGRRVKARLFSFLPRYVFRGRPRDNVHPKPFAAFRSQGQPPEGLWVGNPSGYQRKLDIEFEICYK
jgi:hypothetical protein